MSYQPAPHGRQPVSPSLPVISRPTAHLGLVVAQRTRVKKEPCAAEPAPVRPAAGSNTPPPQARWIVMRPHRDRERPQLPPTGRWPCLVEAALGGMHGAGVGWAEVGAIGTQAGPNFCRRKRGLAATQRGERHRGHRHPGTRRQSRRRIQRGGIGVVSAVGGHCNARWACTHCLEEGEHYALRRIQKALANSTGQPEIARSTLGRIWGGQSPAPGDSHRQSLSATAPED